MKICELDVGYKYEGPRFIRLGPYSGEEFRIKHLLPWLNTLGEGDVSVFDFEGTMMYSPSFLEEGFGGSIRKAKTKEEAEKNRAKLECAKFVNIDPEWNKKLNGYIKNANHNPDEL